MQVAGYIYDVVATVAWVAFVFWSARRFLLALGPKLFPPSPAPLAPPSPYTDAVTKAYVDEVHATDEHLRSVILGMREVPPTGVVMIRAPHS